MHVISIHIDADFTNVKSCINDRNIMKLRFQKTLLVRMYYCFTFYANADHLHLININYSCQNVFQSRLSNLILTFTLLFASHSFR